MDYIFYFLVVVEGDVALEKCENMGEGRMLVVKTGIKMFVLVLKSRVDVSHLQYKLMFMYFLNKKYSVILRKN